MPMYEIALPPGAENIRIKTSTQEIPIEPTFYRHSKDGAIPIVALFGGDEFVGEVLEGQWKKGNDGSIQGPFTAKLNGSGSLELTGKSDTAGTWRAGWLSTKSKIVLVDDLTIDIHLRLPNLADSNEYGLEFYISSIGAGNDPLSSDYLRVDLKATTTTYRIFVEKRISGTSTVLLGTTDVTYQEGTFRIKFQEHKAGHYHTHIYYHDGAGSIDESTDEIAGSPFELNLALDSAFVGIRFATSEATNHTVSSDFVRVTYPDFKITYDLDDDAYRGEGEELLKLAYDTSGNGNHGMVYGAVWVRDGKFGKALSFDGDDYVEVPDSDSLDLTGAFTLSAWIKPLEYPATYGGIIVKRGGPDSYRYYLTSAKKLYGLISTDVGDYSVTSGSTVSLDTWTHVVFRYSKADGKISLYINGALDKEESADGDVNVTTTKLYFGCYAPGNLHFSGLIDEVCIYNRALSENEIQTLYNGGEVTDGLVGEWKFDGDNDRAEVKVYDTNNSDDESDWTRVFDVNHQFVGDCVVENGLIRVQIKEGQEQGFKLHWWNGESWEQFDGFLKIQQQVWNSYPATTPYLEKIEKLTMEEVRVRLRMHHSSYSTILRISIRRGSYLIEIEVINSTASQVSVTWPGSDCTIGLFSFDAPAYAPTDTGATHGNESDNGSLAFNTSDTRIFLLVQTTKEGGMQNWSNGSTHSDLICNASWMTTLPQTVFLAITPFSKVSNLFKEAEDATLLNGATVDTTQSDDSGDSVLLDSDGERCKYTFSDLPVGRYIAFVRAKDTNQISNDLEFSVYNRTDGRYISEEGEATFETLTGSFAYYGRVFDITEDDIGDELELFTEKATANANSIYIDYFLIIPIGNGESWPQDLAHNAMRTFEKEVKVYPR